MKKLILLLATLSVACGTKGKEDSPQSKAGGEKSVGEKSCDVQVAALGEWMTKFVEEGGEPWPAIETNEDFEMVTLAAGAQPPGEHAAVVSMSREVVLVEGTPVLAETFDVGTLAKVLVKAKQLRHEATPPRGTIGLVVDKGAPWSRVVATVEAASQAGLPEVEFFFKNPPPDIPRTLSAPPPSSMTKDIAAARKEMIEKAGPADPAEKQRPLTDSANKSAGSTIADRIAVECPALQANYKAGPGLDLSKRLEHMTDGVVAAVRDCDCKADIAALKESYWFLLSRDPRRPTNGGIVVKLVQAEESGAVVIAAPGDSTWQDVHTKIAELAQTGTPPAVVLKAE